MDTKAKIEEMLRLKREGSRTEKPREPEQPEQPLQPLPNEQHGTVMDRINSMLKQKQAQTDEPAPPAAVPPAVTQPEEVAVVQQRLNQLPFGLCACCRPSSPLVGTEEGRIFCPTTRFEYVRNVDGTIAQRPPEVDLQSTNSIEAALNEGNAAFYYGGFIGGQNQEQQTPRRRRRR
jgi:hypothetical protein